MQYIRKICAELTSREDFIPFIKYLIIGSAVYVFYIVGTSLSVEIFDQPIMFSNIIFYILSIFLAYIANYYWSFQSSQKHKLAFIKYVAVSIIGLSINAVFIYSLSVIFAAPIWLSTTAFSALWPIISFIAQKKFVYK